MRISPLKTTATGLLLLWSVGVFAEIFACEGDDGVTSYQDQPCAEPKPAEAKGNPETEAGLTSPLEIDQSPGRAAPIDPELVAACKKRYRDAIDQLDAEIRKGIAADEREAYRERARALSQLLSRCEYGGADKTSGDGGPEPVGRDL